MPTSTDTGADLLRTLGVLAEPPGPAHARLTRLAGLPDLTGADWTEAFVVHLVPHASIYLGPEGMLGGEAADRIAGFWRALRMPVPADPDHLTALLGLYAHLIESEEREPVGARRALRRQARTALLHEHLLSWVMSYTRAMAQIGPPGYVEWSRLLREALRREVAALGVPDRLPAHLRDIPPPATSSLDATLDSVLAPARSGMVLTRGHLAALARDGELGLRMGDRRRVLRGLIEQDPRRTLGLVADAADAWADHHRADQPVIGPTAAYLAERAGRTASLLRDAQASLVDS